MIDIKFLRENPDIVKENIKKKFQDSKLALVDEVIELDAQSRAIKSEADSLRANRNKVSKEIGAQGTVCGGGRYDGLMEELGGQHVPSLGFALGMERLLMLMDKQGIEIPTPDTCDLYIAGLGDNAKEKAFALVKQIRESGLSAETDVVGRGLRAQMKYADKIGAKFSMVLGDNEIEENKAKLKNMETGEQTEISLGEDFATEFFEAHTDNNNRIVAGV